jgi:hypothetical protein
MRRIAFLTLLALSSFITSVGQQAANATLTGTIIDPHGAVVSGARITAPVTPVVFLIMIVFLLVLLGGNNPTQAFLGVAVVALGLPVYLFLFRNKRLVERGSMQ